MNIQLEEKNNNGKFFISENETQLAEMTFTNSAGKIIIEHTEVDPAMEGKGIGKLLVDHAVEYARTNHLKILPLCPFASRVLSGNTKYNDVLF